VTDVKRHYQKNTKLSCWFT